MIRQLNYISKSPKKTEKLGFLLAQSINQATLALDVTPVIALEGELGSGKTTFTKGFARGLGIKSRITSPTFVLMRPYFLKKKGVTEYSKFYHIDAYRVKDYKDFLPLGLKEILSDKRNIILIEWAERVKPILPKSIIKIHIDHIRKNERKIIINA